MAPSAAPDRHPMPRVPIVRDISRAKRRRRTLDDHTLRKRLNRFQPDVANLDPQIRSCAWGGLCGVLGYVWAVSGNTHCDTRDRAHTRVAVRAPRRRVVVPRWSLKFQRELQPSRPTPPLRASNQRNLDGALAVE